MANSNKSKNKKYYPNDTSRKPKAYQRMGLQNLGNTCFMNSGLQCISSVEVLANAILNENELANEVVRHFKSYLRMKLESSQQTFAPIELKRAIGRVCAQFAGYDQQDAFDLMTTLLNAMNDGLNRAPRPLNLGEEDPEYYNFSEIEKLQYSKERFAKRYNSIITDLFYSFQKNVIRCTGCGYEKVRFQAFAFLSVPIPEKTKSSIHLSDCLNLYVKPSKLAKGSDWHCDSQKCNGAARECTFETLIHDLPKVVVIHLRRFRVTTKYGFSRLEKVQDLVKFDLALDMSEWCKTMDSKSYTLVAVSRHYGSLEGGHYNAHCRTNDKWYLCDDSQVREVQERDVENDKAALFLIYVKDDLVKDPKAYQPNGRAKWDSNQRGLETTEIAPDTSRWNTGMVSDASMKIEDIARHRRLSSPKYAENLGSCSKYAESRPPVPKTAIRSYASVANANISDPRSRETDTPMEIDGHIQGSSQESVSYTSLENGGNEDAKKLFPQQASAVPEAPINNDGNVCVPKEDAQCQFEQEYETVADNSEDKKEGDHKQEMDVIGSLIQG